MKGTPYDHKTITALHDSRKYANNVALVLRQVGILSAGITVSLGSASTGYAEDAEPQVKDLWASIKNIFSDTDLLAAATGR